MLHLWNFMVSAAAVIAIVVIAIGLMVGMTDAHRAFARLGAVFAILVLLLVLPPILVGLWRTLSIGQQFGIIMLWGLLVVVFFLRRTRLRSKRGGKR